MAAPLPYVGPALSERLASTRAVLFDLDGTLLDTIGLILESFRHCTLLVLGKELPDDVLMRNIGIPLRVQMREFTDDPGQADEMLEVYRAHNGELHDRMVAAFPGTLEMLQGVAEMELPMGVVTSKARALALRGLEITDLAPFFEVVVASDDTEIHKPDPYPLSVAAAALGADLRYCVYVGDSPHDVRAAVDGGAVSIAATWGVSGVAALAAEGPDITLDSVDEIVPLLWRARAVEAMGAGE